jgi:hypothetical protein
LQVTLHVNLASVYTHRPIFFLETIAPALLLHPLSSPAAGCPYRQSPATRTARYTVIGAAAYNRALVCGAGFAPFPPSLLPTFRAFTPFAPARRPPRPMRPQHDPRCLAPIPPGLVPVHFATAPQNLAHSPTNLPLLSITLPSTHASPPSAVHPDLTRPAIVSVAPSSSTPSRHVTLQFHALGADTSEAAGVQMTAAHSSAPPVHQDEHAPHVPQTRDYALVYAPHVRAWLLHVVSTR